MSGWILRMSVVEARFHRAVATRRHRHLDRLMLIITRLGDPWFMTLFGALLLLDLVSLPHAIAVHAALSGLVTFVVSQILKRAIARPRPSLGIGFQALIEAPDRFSFPSGHSAVSLSMALPIALAPITSTSWAHWPGLAGILLVALPIGAALLIGFSRCYLGVHHPGDVLAGWLLALVTAPLVGLAF